MKKRHLWIVVLFMAPVVCSAQTGDVLSSGKIINSELAKNWVNNFHTQHKGDIQGFTYGKKMLHEILADKSAAGLKISYGLDEGNNLKIVLNAVDTFGTDSEEPPSDDSLPCPDYCPDGVAYTGTKNINNVSEIGSSITEETAREWINNFKRVNPASIKSYVFSKPAVEQVLSQPEGAGMYFARGLDSNGKERMILFGVNKEGKILHGKVGVDTERELIALNVQN